MHRSTISVIGVSIQENREVQMICTFKKPRQRNRKSEPKKRLNIKANTNSTIAAPVNIMIYIRANKECIKNILNEEINNTFIQIYKVRTDPAFAKIPHSSVSKSKVKEFK